MSDLDANAPDTGSQDPAAPADAEPVKDAATLAAEAIASERKRASGAEAARAAEKKRADAAEARLREIEAASRSAKDQELTDVATLRAELEAERKRTADARAEALTKVLDAKYPNARAELPEVVDEAKLAKFEAMLREDAIETPGEPPTPRSTNPSRTASPSNPAAPEKSSKDILNEMRAQFGTQGAADLFGDSTPN